MNVGFRMHDLRSNVASINRSDSSLPRAYSFSDDITLQTFRTLGELPINIYFGSDDDDDDDGDPNAAAAVRPDAALIS